MQHLLLGLDPSSIRREPYVPASTSFPILSAVEVRLNVAEGAPLYLFPAASGYVGGDVGYRVGIHMKSFEEKIPVIVIGGKAGDFLGEYMAGGIIILLGMLSQSGPEQPLAGNFLGTGMHGGAIYTRGPVDKHSLGKGLGIKEACPPEISSIKPYLEEFGRQFDFELDEILKEKFYCIYPTTHRPYGNMYAY